MRRSRPVRFAATLAKGLVYTIAALLLLVGLALLVLETGWAKNQIRRLIVRQANQYLTATLDIGRLEGSFLRGIRLGDIRLVRDGHTIVTVDDVALSYSLRELFESGVVIRRISLARPHVIAARQPDGRWNLGALVKRERASNRQSGPGRPIHILSIEVTDGTVHLADPLTFGAAHVPSQFNDLDARFAFDYVPVAWTLAFEKATWKGGPGELSVSSLSGRFGNGNEGWVFDQLAVETPRSRFTLNGRVDRRTTPTKLDFDVDAPRFAFQEWSGVLTGLRNIAVEGRFHTRLTGPLANLVTDLDLASDGGAIRGSFALDTTVPGWHGKGAVDLQRLDLAHWLNRPDRPSDITGRTTFDLDLQLGRFPKGRYQFAGSHARYMDYEADEVAARGTITPREVLVEDGTATAYGANVRLVSGKIGIEAPYEFTFTGRADGVDLRRVPPQVPVPHVESVLTFGYDVRGSFGMPYIVGSAQFATSTFLGATIEDGGHGTIDTASIPFRYSGEGFLSNIDLNRFGRGLEVDWLQDPAYDGTLAGRFEVEGAGSDLATMTLDGGGRLTRADLFHGRLSDADVSIHIADGSLSASYAGSLAGIDPSIPFADQRFAAALTGTGRAEISVRDLLVKTTTLADYSVEGELQLTAPTSVRGIRVDRGRVTAGIKNGALGIAQLQLTGPDLDASGAGSIQLDGERSSSFEYDIRRATLAAMKPIIGRDVAGILATKGRLTGPATNLRIAGDGSIASLEAAGVKALTFSGTYDATIPPDDPLSARGTINGRAAFVEAFGESIDQISGTAAYDAGKVTLELDVLRSQGITGSLRTSAQLHPDDRAIDLETLALVFRRTTWQLAARDSRVSWDDSGIAVRSLAFTDAGTGAQRVAIDGSWKYDGSGRLTVTTKDVYLDAFAPTNEEPVRYGGVLNLNAVLRGTRDRPIATGDFAITNGRVRRLSYDRLAGTIDYDNQVFRVDLRLDQTPGVFMTATGTVPQSMFDRSLPDGPMNLALHSSSIGLGLLEGLTDVVREVSGTIRLDVTVVGTSHDPHFEGTVEFANAGFLVTSSGSRYRNGRAMIQLSSDRVNVETFHIEDHDGHPLELSGSLGTHELRVGDLAVDARARSFETLSNEFGRMDVDAQLRLRGQFESPRLEGSITVTGGELKVDSILDRALFRPYSTAPATTANVDAIASLNPWDRIGLGIELHVPNTLRMTGENVQVSPGTPLGLGNINIRVLGDLYLYKDPAQPMYVTGSLDRVTGTYQFQGRNFDIDPVSSINFRGDLYPEVFVSVTREISGVETRVTISGPLNEPELRLTSTPALEQSDVLSLIVFGTSTNQLSTLQQQQLAVRAGTLAAGFIAAPLMTALERSLGLSLLEIEPGSDPSGGTRVTIGDELAPGLVARFSRQFGPSEYDEATLEYNLSRILRIRGTFSDADSLVRSPFRRVERAGIDLLLFFSF